jgi:hypothetical protein
MFLWLIVCAYIVTTVAALILSFGLLKSTLRLVARLSAGLLMVPILLIGVVVFLFWEAEPPTIANLQRDFTKRRPELETILRLSNEDAQFSRIAPDFLWRQPKGSDAGGQFFLGDPNSGLRKSRWEQYRDVYRRNGIKLGVERDREGDAFVMLDSIGLLERGHTTGYLYCSDDSRADPERYEPCTLHQDSGKREYHAEPRAEAYSFQRLDSRWFAFDQGPG